MRIGKFGETRPGAVFSRANIYISFRRPVTLNLNKVSN